MSKVRYGVRRRKTWLDYETLDVTEAFVIAEACLFVDSGHAPTRERVKVRERRLPARKASRTSVSRVAATDERISFLSGFRREFTEVAKGKKRRAKRNVTVAVVYIHATFNNTTITITDTHGDTLCWSSAGTCGFKGSRKSTPFAGQCAAQQAAEKAIKFGVKDCDVRVIGPGSGRESAITSLEAAGLKVKSIEDLTPIPHNGCRPKKKRRV